MKEQILGTGLTGLIGSRVVELNPKYDFLICLSQGRYHHNG